MFMRHNHASFIGRLLYECHAACLIYVQYVYCGVIKNHTLHTNAMYVLQLNPYKSLKYAAFGPLLEVVYDSFCHRTVCQTAVFLIGKLLPS